MILVVSDSKEGKSYSFEVTTPKINSLIGKGIGDTIDGKMVGLQDYELLVTGGTDKDGFPMRKDLPGSKRRKILITGGTGYRIEEKGKRKRKMVTGREISSSIAQLNLKISTYGKKSLQELLKKEEKEGESANQ